MGGARSDVANHDRAGGPKAPGSEVTIRSAQRARLERLVQLMAVGITTAASTGSKLASRLA